MPVINTILMLETAKNELAGAAASGNLVQVVLAITKILKLVAKRGIESLPVV